MGKIKLALMSDLHGHLPPVEACDIAIIAGDICAFDDPFLQAHWLDTAFRSWLESIPAKHVIGIAGNHDHIFERMPHIVPKRLRWNYFQDRVATVCGLKIFGSPWTPPFWGSFQKEEHGLKLIYDCVPTDVDIVVSHGPPWGFGDNVSPRGAWPARVGSTALGAMMDRIKPRLVVCGHIHEGHGVYGNRETAIVNAAICDAQNIPVHKPINFSM